MVRVIRMADLNCRVYPSDSADGISYDKEMEESPDPDTSEIAAILLGLTLVRESRCKRIEL